MPLWDSRKRYWGLIYLANATCHQWAFPVQVTCGASRSRLYERCESNLVMYRLQLRSADFHQHHRYVVSRRSLTPCRNVVEDRLLHFGQGRANV